MKMSLPPLSLPRPSVSPCRRGFTLIEVLVAIAVLVLIIVLVAQLTNSASQTTTASNRQVTADVQAQIVFSQMQSDFDGMPKSDLVDTFFWKNNAASTNGPAGSVSGVNDVCIFWSESAGYFSATQPGNQYAEKPYNQSPISIVAYRVNNYKNPSPTYPNQQLARLGRGKIWEGSVYDTAVVGGPVFLSFRRAAATPDPNSQLLSLVPAYAGSPPYDGSNAPDPS